LSRRTDVKLTQLFAPLLLLAVVPGGAQVIDHSNPSAGNADLVANQNYQWGPIFLGGVCRLTDKGSSETGTVYYHERVNVSRFQTSFVFQIIGGGPGDASDGSGNLADGITFVIQNQGLDALGEPGGSLGYGGITKSVAVKFDPVPNGWGNVSDPSYSSTGIYVNGETPAGGHDLLRDGVNLRSGHPFRVDMEYDGAVLAVRITDQVTGAASVQRYRVDIPSIVGGRKAFVGFTAATGLGTASQDLIKWYYASEPIHDSTRGFRRRVGRAASRKQLAAAKGATVAPWPTRALSAKQVMRTAKW
jgi:hypothetical protein